MKAALTALGIISLSLTLHAGWIVQPDSARITYSAQRDEGYASFADALKELAESHRIQKLEGIVAYELLPDDTFQNELFTALERDAPRELKEARHSAGNMHNPKMIQLWKPFEKALLSTPTITSLNASLAPYGLMISRAGVEKFELRRTLADSRRRFYGALWLYVTKVPNHAMQLNASARGPASAGAAGQATWVMQLTRREPQWPIAELGVF